MKNLIIAYCVENQYVAAKIASALTGKIEIEKVVFDVDNGIEVLKKAANNNTFPVLLLISDNFLKSERCMNDALPFIQSLGHSKRLIPVTTEGVYTDSESGKVTTVTTSFDRVSNVIQFMNHWQDRYLELRKLKDEGDESIHNEKVRIVRAISSEIGELLRYFRTIEFYTFDQFNESNFVILMRVLGLDVSKHTRETPPTAVVQTVASQPTEVAYSNGIKKANVLKEEEPDVDLSGIPGIAQLNERMNVRDSSLGGLKDADLGKIEDKKPEKPNNKEIEEKSNEEKPSLIEKKDAPLTLESLVQDIRTDEKYLLKDSVNESQTSEIQNEIPTQDSKSEKYEETAKLDASVKAGLTFEDFVNDEKLSEIMEKQAPIEESKSIIKDAEDSKDVLPENKESEISAEVINEAEIQDEVVRLFDEAELTDPHFDFESQMTQVIGNQQDSIENAQITEGVVDKTPLKILQKSVAADPMNNALRYQYASELTNQNRYSEATEQLDILLDYDRTNVDAYILLAYLAEQQGDFILSLNSLEKVTLLNQNYPGIYYKLGRLTNDHFKKQNRKALRYFKEAVAQDSSNVDARYHYARVLIEQKGDFNTAIEHLLIAIEQDPNRDDLAFELAKAYFEINDKANAAKWYARATEMNTHHKTDSNDQLFYYEEPKPEPIIPAVIDNGLTVLITGATAGIGKATAEIFAKHGYRLILTGRRGDRLEAMKSDFETEYKNRIQVLNFDVRNLNDIKKSLSELEEDFKNVDILINNAGLASGFASIHEGEIEDWDKMIDTNIKGLLYMTRAIAPSMVARRKGHIVNLGSIAGKEIYPNGNIYSATKFAVDALTRAMRVDMHKYNIRVSQVSPGAVEETEFAMVRFHGDVEKASIYKDFTPLKASDVAETIYFMVTRPEYVNIQDVVMMGTQQGSANHFDRSGRTDVETE